jgi:hypothetical protein
MSKFLDDLKNSVESGEFNSEAAKKIIEVDKLADSVSGTTALEELQEKVGVKSVTDEEVGTLNSTYVKKMEEINKLDIANKQLAMLIDMEDMVKMSIGDLMSYVTHVEIEMEKELKENSIFNDLSLKIEEIKNHYK